ncbi:MAG TPA: EAL domain-containing protein [Candidatus Limnocylindrales bacterium]|nr:EAL domain-containing protein [Candidatus Limnocylindrales bacterium]
MRGRLALGPVLDGGELPVAAALYSLDEARPLSRAGRLAAWVGALVYLGASLGVLSQGSDPWPPLVWVPIAHALVLVVVCGLTSLLLYGQASATGRRGYLWLGGTYLYVAVLLLSFPLFFPGGFGGEEPFLGGQQSAPWMFYIWHFAFAGGLMVAVWVFHIDRVRHRRPGLVVDMWPSVVGVVIAALLTVGFVAVEDTAFRPTLLAQDVGLTSFAAALDWLLLGFSLAATALSLWCQRGGALIQRWLSAVLVLQLGAAIVNMNASRWSFGWYFDRLFGMVALTSLLIFLVFSLARAGQATNIVASSDTLTRSESRASFTQSMEQEIAAARLQGQSVALLWVDLDGFKAVNDQFGHQVGDDVLRVTVNRILGQVRDADHVGRLGGDEIGVLLCEGAAEAPVTPVAERILAALREPMHIDELLIHITGSIGIATFPTDGDRPDELITRADLAMYAAKNAGGDRCLQFSAELGSEAMDTAQLRHDLARAVRSADFELAYQPIVALESGAVAGVEALARWRHHGQLVPAARFMAFAERTGQIVAIGRLILEVVERDVDEVLAALPPDSFLAVNLSAREMSDDIHLDRLLAGPLHARAGRVVLEVTESSELLEKPDITHRLVRLREAGYRLAVDDFGAGFSNFTRLEAMRPDLLKIDRALVARAGTGEEGGIAFLTAARSVAESLHCPVIAEGVQTAAERDAVLATGIALAQGHLLGRPVPLDQLATLSHPSPQTARHDGPHDDDS